jgi:hypothetical protein
MKSLWAAHPCSAYRSVCIYPSSAWPVPTSKPSTDGSDGGTYSRLHRRQYRKLLVEGGAPGSPGVAFDARVDQRGDR